MSQVIENKSFDRYFEKITVNDFPSVCLIHGDEFLAKSILSKILGKVLPGTASVHNYEPLDGRQGDNVFAALEHMNTYSMLAETKVVALLDSSIFYSKADNKKLIDKIQTEYAANQIRNAALSFLKLLSFYEMDLSEISTGNSTLFGDAEVNPPFDQKMVTDLVDYCRENRLSPVPGQDLSQLLVDAISKGFPKGNILIIVTDLIDKRRMLYKTIKEKGIVIDCSVPTGERFADKKIQKGIMTDRMQQLLKDRQKRISPQAASALFDFTGFDIRGFSNNLLKVIDYIGGRDEITTDDLQAVLKRTKKDPIYELTSAIADRSLENALFFLRSLIDNDVHPLAILTAITNQIRKLLTVKAFLTNNRRINWQPGMSFDHFKNSTLQWVVEHDKKMLEQLQNWPEDDLIAEKKSRKKTETDLLLAKNPKNPYPIYQTFLKTENYKQHELIRAYFLLSDTDFRLKRTGLNNRLHLENLIIQICS